jgi:hypothetical protein
LDQVREEGRLQRRARAQLHSQEIAERVKQAIEQLRNSGQMLTRKAIGEIVGLTPNGLHNYESVGLLLAEVGEELHKNNVPHKHQREKDLIEQMRRAINYLRETKQPVTLRALGKIIGCTDGGLMYYSGLRKLYRQVMEENRQASILMAQQRGEALLLQVKEAIEQLKNLNRPVTQRNVANSVGMTTGGLRRYPHIKVILQELVNDGRKKMRNSE